LLANDPLCYYSTEIRPTRASRSNPHFNCCKASIIYKNMKQSISQKHDKLKNYNKKSMLTPLHVFTVFSTIKFYYCQSRLGACSCTLLFLYVRWRHENQQVTKVIRQKAASPCCQPSRLRTDSFDLGLHLTHCSSDPHESAQPPNGISIGSAVFAQLTRVTSTRTQTHRPRSCEREL